DVELHYHRGSFQTTESKQFGPCLLPVCCQILPDCTSFQHAWGFAYRAWLRIPPVPSRTALLFLAMGREGAGRCPICEPTGKYLIGNPTPGCQLYASRSAP